MRSDPVPNLRLQFRLLPGLTLGPTAARRPGGDEDTLVAEASPLAGVVAAVCQRGFMRRKAAEGGKS